MEAHGGRIGLTSEPNTKAMFQADMVVHAAGRVPEINDLNLDAAGIEWAKRGVRVNEFLQSVSIPGVYAAGDAAASEGPPLAPVASYEGLIVAANLLKGSRFDWLSWILIYRISTEARWPMRSNPSPCSATCVLLR